MKSETQIHQTYKYSDLYSEYFFHRRSRYTKACPEHTLIFIFSGELTVKDDTSETIVRKGEYIFLRKDTNTVLVRNSCNGETFSSVYIGLNRCFLGEFYRLMKKTCIPHNDEQFDNSIIVLPRNPYMDSIYVSLLPYFDWKLQPTKAVLEIKLMEAIFSLLQTDWKFYDCLFGFLKPFEIDSTTEVHAEQTNSTIKKFTCRKRNMFHAIQEDIKWQCTFKHPQLITSKKMETDYIRKKHAGKTTEIYFEVTYHGDAQLTETICNHYNTFPPN